MKTATIRQTFLNYFAARHHTIVPSSTLIPAGDKTLLFTNAGMVQFKDTFLGREARDYSTATSVQRCVRAGGKHNDLENVGFTARHHTFFEMLGNFSFGDYFKREAIGYAWEFLTDVLKLPPEKLWVTVYEEDDEAADIWLKELGVSADRFSRCGAKDNFWSMGDTGPCGPCTEIFYDHGEAVSGGPPGSPDEDGDRYIEIWNLVFMQYNRDEAGTLSPLPRPSVDTGMGLERLAAVLQGGHSNYDIDLFQRLMKDVATLLGVDDHEHTSIKVIADHIRACAFLALDGVRPSNEGRGYVLRRIIRRAVRHGVKLGAEEAFFYRLVPTLVAEMGEAYPDLAVHEQKIADVLRHEEEKFSETVASGLKILEDAIATMNDDLIDGELVFRLYDTYGFPVDLTEDIARERGLRVDNAGFERQMEAQRQRARGASQFKGQDSDVPDIAEVTEFVGYDMLETTATIVALVQDGQLVDSLDAGQNGQVVLDRTPFYAESGGQAADKGEFLDVATVVDVKKHQQVVVHHVHARQALHVGNVVTATVNRSTRVNTAAHHSATHLLHAALRQILGDHVEQKGSLVRDANLRFDFSHFAAVTAQELVQIEALVNAQIREAHDVVTRVMDLESARKSGAMALFDEKYDSKVRVLSMGDFSVELCGGTHVANTADIGYFKIVAESGIASGVRRIEALSGDPACTFLNAAEATLASVEAAVGAGRDAVVDKVAGLLEKLRQQEKENERLKQQLAGNAAADLLSQSQSVGEAQVLVVDVGAVEAGSLRDMVDSFKSRLDNAVVVLIANTDGKLAFVSGVAKNMTGKIKAGDIVRTVAGMLDGKGGGRPDFAQGGGGDATKVAQALVDIQAWIAERLEG
jgi:alanyl-tRNA synthetase